MISFLIKKNTGMDEGANFLSRIEKIVFFKPPKPKLWDNCGIIVPSSS